MTNSFKKVALVLSVFAIIFSFSAHDVFADTVTTDFETFTNGSVNGQGGWSVTNPAFDQAVVNNTYGYTEFGTKVWRLSNNYFQNSFGDHTFSVSTNDEAGETSAVNGGYSGGTRKNRIEASFDIASTLPTEQWMTAEVSVDRGDGSRMGFLQFDDEPNTDGIKVYFYGGEPGYVGMKYSPLLATLSRTEVHTLKMVMDFYEAHNNDVVKIYIDNVLVYTGTTWENYYRYAPGQGGAPRTSDNLLFRAMPTSTPGNQGEGFLFDNIRITTSDRNQEVWVDDVATNGDGTEANPFNTIAEGVTKVATGGTVHVAPGAYAEAVTVAKAMTIQSTTDAVLTGSIAINSNNVVVTGLTVINPNAATTGTIDLSTLIPSGTGVLPQMTVTSALNTVVLDIPTSTTVTAPGWDGVLHLPTLVQNSTITTPVVPGQTSTVGLAISVGSTVPMSFDKGVRLLFPGEAGKKVGFSQSGGTLIEITDVCSADTQTVGDTLQVEGNCVITVGSDLVVWTKHFTTFATYATTPVSVAPAATTSVRRVVGGTSASVGNSVTQAVSPTAPAGQVLGEQTYVFTINQKMGIRGHVDVVELQKYLNKRNFAAGIEDGIFGAKTATALKAFQKGNGLTPDGLVGPMTRAVLNK